MSRHIDPCPYCGSIYPDYRVTQYKPVYKGCIVCHGCGTRGPWQLSIDEAVRAWNELPRREGADGPDR